MACVEGDLGKKINELMEKSNEKYDEGNYKQSIELLKTAWDFIPEDKNKYDESSLIVWGILDIAILVNDIETMNSWVEKIFKADPERGDFGEREMWAGKVAFESGNKEKAMHYFDVANKKSRGRCFSSEGDFKYKEFFIKEKCK